MTDEDQHHLTILITELSSKVQMILDKQEELAENISKIKEAVYNPYQGLYARLKELDIRIQHIELWKNAYARLMWIVGASVIGLLVKAAWGVVF